MDDAIAALDGQVIPIYIGFKGCFDIMPDQIIQPDVRILFLKKEKEKNNHNSKFCYLFSSAQYHNNDAINDLIRLELDVRHLRLHHPYIEILGVWI